MTITNEEYVKRIADSGTTIDITNFQVRSTGEVLVTKYDTTSDATLVITTDYTINATLTTVTLNDALTSGERAVATVNIGETQGEDYTINSANNAGKLEDQLDKITLNLKKQQERLDRVLINQLSSTVTGLVFASFVDKAHFYTRVSSDETTIDLCSLGGATFWSGFTLPAGDGSANEVLYTDGSATLAWGDPEDLGTGIFAYVTVSMMASGTNIPQTIINSLNVTSVVMSTTAAENYVVNFSKPAPDLNYMLVGNFSRGFNSALHTVSSLRADAKTTSAFTGRTGRVSGADAGQQVSPLAHLIFYK